MHVFLAFLGANAGYVSIGALMLSVFCAGSMLQAERVRKQEIRDALHEIEVQTDSTLQRIARIDAWLQAEDRRLVAEIETTYGELADVSAAEASARRALAESRRQLDRPQLRPRPQPAFQGFTIRND
jgi:hypothetical protein